jgi:hypothetical protein
VCVCVCVSINIEHQHGMVLGVKGDAAVVGG